MMKAVSRFLLVTKT